jgi:methionine sulfoxide reductase heme-binding subunit
MATALKSWRLFWVLALAISTADCLALPHADFHSLRGTEFIVWFTVVCALPCLLVAFSTSSVAILWPNRNTRWLLANRRYIGLAFAFGMSWHFVFVAYFLARFGYHMRSIDLTVDIIGLCLLIAMTLTSFPRFARRLSIANWRRLHRTGIYTLWFLPIFFFLDDYLRDHEPLYLVMLGILFAPLALRLLAWRHASVAVRSAA